MTRKEIRNGISNRRRVLTRKRSEVCLTARPYRLTHSALRHGTAFREAKESHVNVIIMHDLTAVCLLVNLPSIECRFPFLQRKQIISFKFTFQKTSLRFGYYTISDRHIPSDRVTSPETFT